MINFTSSLYLGMKHSSAELKGWEQLTAGVPAVLHEPALSKQVTACIAHMQGLENGMIAPSTMHLYWDLFGLLVKRKVVVFIDEKIYPVSKYGIEKLAIKQIPVHTFRHFDAKHLATLVKTLCPPSLVPIVMSDGWCPVCGCAAPVKEYLQIINKLKGELILDDTQAFGILGAGKSRSMPYGYGGGGVLQWQHVQAGNIVTIVSLAKAFGAPMAIISGNHTFINAFRQNSATCVHSSPVSMVHLLAAANAIGINRSKGECMRKRLWQNVCLLRNELCQIGIQTGGGVFPVQSITCLSPAQTVALYNRLTKSDIKTVLAASHTHRAAVTFVVRSDHTLPEIKALATMIKHHARQTKKPMLR